MTDVHSQHRHRSSSDADEVVEYLQLAGRRYLEHVELLRQEQQVREAQHAPFKPTITAYAEAASKTSVVRHGSSIGDRLHELHQKKLVLLAEEAAEDARRHEAAEKSLCTFTPAVTARADRTSRIDGDVGASLRRWEEQRRARQARRQAEATRNERSSVTGVPRISAYAVEKAEAERVRRAVPIEASLLADAAARRQRQHAAYEGSGAASASPSSSLANVNGGGDHRRASPPFAPAISAFASQMRFTQGVVDRLYTHHRTEQQSQQQQQQRRGYDEEVALHCTFHPRLSPQSTALSRQYFEDEGEAGANPHDRLFRNMRHPSKFRKPFTPDTSSGQPEISDASRRMVEEQRRQRALDGDPGALGHSPGSRLYPQKAPTDAPPRPTFKKPVVTARDEELRVALTFAPAVSATSDAMWRQRVTALKSSGAARTAEDARQLLWRKAEKKRAEEVARLQAQRRREEAAVCTFHPQAGRPPHRRTGYLAMPIEARTQLWAKQRDTRLSELREEVDGSVLDACTFHPHVDPVFPLPRPDAKLATGVAEFVERQAEARRQREAVKEWWRPQYARTASANNPHASSSGQRGHRATATQRAISADASVRSRGNSLHRTARSASVDGSVERVEEEEEDEEVFEQHWTRPPPPPSTSLTASSFSHASQPDVPSAESSPRLQAYRVLQRAAAATAEDSAAQEADDAARPYRWRSPAERREIEGTRRAHTTTASAATASPAWRKPLRYRAR